MQATQLGLRSGASLPAKHLQPLPSIGVLPGRLHLRRTSAIAASSASGAIPLPTGGGGGSSGGIGGHGSGGGGGSGGSGASGAGGHGGVNPALGAVLLSAGRSVDSFPSDFAAAMLSGKVPVEILKRFLELEQNFITGLVMGFTGFRERLLADPSFPVKLGIELCIGVVMKVAAEKTKRKDNFWREIDFVGANIVMALIADFMLTWLPAPTLSYVPKTRNTNPLTSMFAGCPDNAFQRVRPGQDPFTLGQRVGAIIRNGMKLLGVGFFASLLGVGMTNGIALMRQAMDPNWSPPNKAQDVVSTSAAYGVYMSVSSNLRYQIVAGVLEERGIETVFKGNHQLCHLLSFIIRTGNTFVGSLLWVDFVRLCGMQKAPGEENKAETEAVVAQKGSRKRK